jgi:hypothetical protein
MQLRTEILTRLRRSQQREKERTKARLTTRNDRGASRAWSKPEQPFSKSSKQIADGAHWSGENRQERIVGEIYRTNRCRTSEHLPILLLDVNANC